MASEMNLPQYSAYGGTKIFEKVFGNIAAYQMQRSRTTQGLVDGLILEPSMVTSNMNNFKTVPYVSSTADECTRGALSDLGDKKKSYGSLLHSAFGMFFVPIAPTVFKVMKHPV